MRFPPCFMHHAILEKKELSPATKRLLKRMENAKPLGLPDDPHKLSHSVLAEERMDEKFPWEGSYENDILEAFLSVAEEDWHDWADPKEDVYEEYKAWWWVMNVWKPLK